MQIDAILLKPLDGFPEGSSRSFDKPDFDRLRGMGAVREAGETTKINAPAQPSPARLPAKSAKIRGEA